MPHVQVHADQLEHVKKGCLERTREDLACDGSRIEGSHKSWNSIMRSYASGIEVFTSLGHDLTLRRNLRMAASILLSNTSPAHLNHTKAFAASILGSHHVRLANATAKLWNTLATISISKPALRLILRSAAVYEKFGLVPSKHNSSFGGLLQIKEESDDEDGFGALDPGTGTISHLNIDPLDLHVPLPVSSTPTASSSSSNGVQDGRASRQTAPTLNVPSSSPISLIPASVPQLPPSPSFNVDEQHAVAVSTETINRTHIPMRERHPTTTTSGTAAAAATFLDIPTTAQAHTLISSYESGQLFLEDRINYLGTNTLKLAGNVPREPATTVTSAYLKRKFDPASNSPTSLHEPAPAAKKMCIQGSTNKVRIASSRSHIPLIIASSPLAYSQGTQVVGRSGALGSFYSIFANSPHTEKISPAPSERERNHDYDHDHPAATRALSAELLSPLPPPSTPSKLTPSEHLFLVSTSINPRSLKISEDVEFFTFMDLRAQQKWTSFSMTSRMWVKATADYNALLATRCRTQGLPDPLLKHPRALVEKLGEVETTIVRRVATKDFKCEYIQCALFVHRLISLQRRAAVARTSGGGTAVSFPSSRLIPAPRPRRIR